MPVETVEKIIAVCPDEDWRLIFALPRFAGVRFPSEVEDLKWSDIDWQSGWFTVHEKKVEHHPGRGRRVVPIFEALLPHLERAHRERAPGAVYVVPRARHGANLGTQAKRFITKAGIEPWPKLFTNLRGSCSDDLARERFPEKAIDRWIGNTARLRRDHYHGVRPEDWAAATGKTVRDSVRPAAFSGVQPLPTPRPAREKSLDVEDEPKIDYPRQGLVTSAVFPGKHAIVERGRRRIRRSQKAAENRTLVETVRRSTGGQDARALQITLQECTLVRMVTLADIEAAAVSLSPAEKQELMLFLASRLRAEGAKLPEPRVFSADEMGRWIAEDEADMRRLREQP